jgi:tRNA threonylcarbamoyladenosine biosynthesis protein TsaB
VTVAWAHHGTDKLTRPMNPCLLALDTSTERMAVAVLAPSGRQLCRVEEGGARASERVLPLALELMGEAGVTLSQVDAVAFGQGPGAFTGLRTACAVAQGLAAGRGCPVLPLDSLCLVAEDARPFVDLIDREALVWSAVDARMGEVYAASYRDRPESSGWQIVHAPALYTVAALANCWHLQPPAVVVGDASVVHAGALPMGGARCWTGGGDRAQALARMALHAWRNGTRLAAHEAAPVYLRDKVALTTAERALAGARAG